MYGNCTSERCQGKETCIILLVYHRGLSKRQSIVSPWPNNFPVRLGSGPHDSGKPRMLRSAQRASGAAFSTRARASTSRVLPHSKGPEQRGSSCWSCPILSRGRFRRVLVSSAPPDGPDETSVGSQRNVQGSRNALRNVVVTHSGYAGMRRCLLNRHRRSKR